MRFSDLRDEGRKQAVRALGDLWRRLPITQATRYRIQSLFPAFTNELSNRSQPPPEYKRPPARLRAPVVRADAQALGHRASEDRSEPTARSARLVALYVATQDWSAVTGARPQFDGHAQPRLPGVLGYYDSVSPDVLRAQVALAERHGVSAFAFQLSADREGPADRFVADPGLRFGFCVLWSDDDGRDPASFMSRVASYLADPRYLREAGRAVILIERPDHLRLTKAITDGWRHAAQRAGLGELYLVSVQPIDAPDPTRHGLDLALIDAVAAAEPVTSRQQLINAAFSGEVFDGRGLGREPPKVGFPARWLVNAGWDDEPRAPGRGTVFQHASPRLYADWLRRELAAASSLVFIDAWNDWPRGAVLEPDARLGHAYLLATRQALSPPQPDRRPHAVVHVYYLELLDEIAAALQASGLPFRLIVTTPTDRADAVRQRVAELGLAAEVEAHENRGRDILPFLRVANRLLDEGVEVVLKLHTKHSGHRTDGDRWRSELIGRLLEPARATHLFEAFARDRALGCVAPEGHLLPFPVYWGWNEETVRYLCLRMGVADPDLARDRFCAGSMFWVRLAALRPLLDAHLGEWEFEPEGGYIDGTMAHGIERALALAVKGAGFDTRTAAEVCGIPFDHDTAYAYAEASAPVRHP